MIEVVKKPVLLFQEPHNKTALLTLYNYLTHNT